MKARDFDYRRPRSLDEAFDLLERPGAQVIAGGQSLVPELNLRTASAEMLVDISALEELRDLRLAGEGSSRRLHIGALVRHVEIERSPLVAEAAPLLQYAAAHVAYPAVRNLGTFCGSLALGNPASEFPMCALALDADLLIAARDGRRTVAAREFFLGFQATGLRPREILVGCEVPLRTTDWRYGFAELRRGTGWATVGVALHGRPAPGGGSFGEVAVAVLGGADRPILAPRAAAALCDPAVAPADRGRDAQAALAKDLDPPPSPTMAGATRLHLARVLLGRAIAQALKPAGGADVG